MKAYKISAQVSKDRMVRLRLPDEVDEGSVEVIVLVPDGTRPAAGHTVEEFLQELDSQRRRIMTKEEIDRYIEDERAEWE